MGEEVDTLIQDLHKDWAEHEASPFGNNVTTTAPNNPKLPSEMLQQDMAEAINPFVIFPSCIVRRFSRIWQKQLFLFVLAILKVILSPRYSLSRSLFKIYVSCLNTLWQRYLIVSVIAQHNVIHCLRYLFNRLLVHLHMSVTLQSRLHLLLIRKRVLVASNILLVI